MQAFLWASKLVTVFVWLWALAGSFGADVPMAALGAPVALVLIVVHTLEVLLFMPRLKEAPGSLTRHVLGVLCFGLFHMLSLQLPRES